MRTVKACLRLTVLLSLVAGLIFAAVPSSVPVVAQEDSVPRFEPVDCWFDVPPDQTIDCGYVVVPEDRADPDNDATIRLAVAVVRDQSEHHRPDPVMLLSGGPGEKTIENGAVYPIIFAPVYPNRDFIFFDQRGVGFSEPALECPEFSEAALATLNEADPDVNNQGMFSAMMACRDRLVEEGYNLSAYNTTQNAADVNDVRIALGYDEVNLLGVSYGSVLAQATMRDFPEGIRSVVIDSVLPLSGSLFVDSYTTAPNALLHLLEACETDEACSAAYPNLQDVLFEVIDRLNAEPVPTVLTNPLTGETQDALLTGDAVVDLLYFFLYQTPVIPLLPQTIYDLRDGNYELMTQLGGTFLVALDAISRGMSYSVFCTDDLIGRTPDEILEQMMALPPQIRGADDPEITLETSNFAVCENWPVEEADPSVKEPVVSDLPTLVFSGEFDPVTPAVYGQQVAESLSNSFFFEFPGVGHSVNLASPCAQSITVSFLDDPTSAPDSACFEEMTGVQFIVPGGAELTLEPYTSESFGFSGVIPEGWEELAPGTFGAGMTATTIILQQALPGDVDAVTALLQTQLGLTGFPESAGTREANGLTWTLYELEIQGQQADLAVTDSEGMAYLIMLISGPGERDRYYEGLFLPAVDALVPAE